MKFLLDHDVPIDISYSLVHEKAVPKGLKKQALGMVTYSLFIPGSMPTGIANDPWKGLSSLPLALPLGGQLREALEEKFKKKVRIWRSNWNAGPIWTH